MKGIRGLRQQGVSLIEVMVALLVLGIGVMGYAALQLNAVKITEDTYSRSQAMAIAQDLIERVRANSDVLGEYAADAAWTDDAPDASCYADAPSKLCDASEMASADISQIRQLADAVLPNGSIKLATCGGIHCVTVAWSETSATSGAGCNPTQIENNDRGANASCIIVEFIP